MRFYRSLSDWREDLFGDPNGTYISVQHDTRPGVFCGWTVYLGVNGDRCLHAHSCVSRSEAFKVFRYKISKIALVPQAKCVTIHQSLHREYFSADFSGTTGLHKWNIRKTLDISEPYTPGGPKLHRYKLEWSASWRNTKGQFVNAALTPQVEMRLLGSSIKEIQSKLKTLIPLCIKWS
jgi:hypothetical protein